MQNATHDPSEYLRGLQHILIGDKKKIAFLFGAGTSLAKKNKKSLCIPAIYKMTEEIIAELVKTVKYVKPLEEIQKEIGTDKFNIERLLSNLEQKQQVIAGGVLNGLKKEDFRELVKLIKTQIRKKVGIHEKVLSEKCIDDLIHVDFAEWIARADRKYPIEIFTTNYDYFFELGMEYKNVPYYDGFTGSHRPFFNPESVEDFTFLPQQVKLWKLHGSLGWHYEEETKKVLRKDSNKDDILIYPSILKYNDSKKQPYISLMDRLTNYLKQDDAVLIVCGYSFGDEHINERILTALNSKASSHVIALYYDIVRNGDNKKYLLDDKQCDLAKMAKSNGKLSIYGCRSAIVGCQLGKWQLKVEPDKTDTLQLNRYFDEDAYVGNDKIKVEKKGEESWTGEGELLLPDYARFVGFLKSMIVDNKMLKGVESGKQTI